MSSRQSSFLNFPDTDILLFQGGKGESKLPLDLDLFPDDGIEDPFSYREDSLSSPSGGTPESSLHLQLSSSSSPDRCGFPDTPDSGSLSDVPGFDPIDSSSFSNLRFISPTHKDDYEEDLDFRAPFIPMQMDDDFPLLSPSSHVMWGPPQEPPLPRRNTTVASPASSTATHDRLSDSPPSRQSKSALPSQQSSLKSSLAALLQSDTHNNNNNNKKNNRNTNDRNNNKRWHASDSKARQRNNNHFTPSRTYPGSGHIIMLDSVPPVTKNKPSPASLNKPQAQRKAAPSIGSHTSTMRVNDRLIKVQVCVSELPSSNGGEKQPFPSPPDPPPKRALPPTTQESPKRMRGDSSVTQGSTQNSVLLNLLISGEDASRGYLCSGNSRHSENKFAPAVVSLPANDLSADLDTEEDLLLDSYLKVQYEDMDELLEHPLLRNNPTISI